jgi:hypothetical protein
MNIKAKKALELNHPLSSSHFQMQSVKELHILQNFTTSFKRVHSMNESQPWSFTNRHNLEAKQKKTIKWLKTVLEYMVKCNQSGKYL